MKTMAGLVLALAILGPSVPASWAQRTRGAGARAYDPRTVETVSGEVVGVEDVAPTKGRSGGVHVTLKTDSGSIPVHLGPAWYVDKQKLQVRQGDHVEVEGSRVSFAGKPAIIARQVKKDGETLILRNEAGVPAWAGRGAGPRPRS
jgi:hypothetical protein